MHKCAGRWRIQYPIQGKTDVSKLLELMRELGRNAALAREYEADPDAVIQQAGLSDEERRALMEKDYDAIKRLTGLTDGQFSTNHMIRAYDE